VRSKDCYNPYIIMQSLKNKGKFFSLEKTAHTMKIILPDGNSYKWISPNSGIPKKELFFLRMVKDAVNKLLSEGKIIVPDIDRGEIKYYETPRANFITENCYEFDISGAYWRCAKDFLPSEIFEKGLTVSKITRLAALGLLARSVIKMDYTGKEFIYMDKQVNETANLFFYCSLMVSEIMQNCVQVCDGYLFFWVDAIFTSNKNDLKYIEAVLNNFDMTGKSYFCEKVESNDKAVIVYSSEHKAQKRVFLKKVKNSDFFIESFKNNQNRKHDKNQNAEIPEN